MSLFPTTEWTAVLKAGRTNAAEAAPALERLCRIYWYPLYAFVRRKGHDAHAAEDLTQEFFAGLFERDAFKQPQQEKGRFRTFLLTSLNFFLINEWHRRRSQKRGGTHQIISWDEAQAENFYQNEPADHASPEKLFERRWAFTVMNQVLARLKAEYVRDDKVELFACLEPGLTNEANPGLYAGWAKNLGMSEGAVRVAVHRLRRRFGELLRSEIAHTVATPEEVDEEIRHLFAAIAE